jgi:hypothetical protein
MHHAGSSSRRPASRIAPVALAAALLAAGTAPGPAAAQGLDAVLAARAKAIPKGPRAFEETWLRPPAGGAASERDLTLAAKVSAFQQAPRERLEIRPVSGRRFGEPVVVVSNGKGWFLVTKLGATPLAESAKASDPLVTAVLGGPAGDAPRKRRVEGAGGKLDAVVYREARPADFSASTAFSLKAPKVGGGLLKKGLASFAEPADTQATASAGARGVDEIETPEGTVSVTPDTVAVAWLDGREPDALELEAFLLAGELGPYAAAGEEAAP